MADSDGILGMGIVLELQDAFSANAQRIQNSMRGLHNSANQMMEGARQQAEQLSKNLSRAMEEIARVRNASANMGTGAAMGGGAGASFGANTKALEDTMQKSMGRLQNSFAGLMAGAGMMAPFAIAINKAREFEQQLSNIKSLGGLGDNMKDVEALAMRMGKETKFSALESAQGIEELLKAGVDLKAIMDKNGLSGALDLAVAGGLKLADAAEIASTALNAFKKDGMTIRDAGNILAGAANASATDVMTLKLSLSAVASVASGMGLSFKDTNAALALFANNGLKGSDAGTSLKTMLMNLQPRSKEQIATFQQLGFMTAQGANAFYNAAGKIRPMNEIAGLLNTKLKHLTDQQRAFALETMFGSDAIRAGNILFKEGAAGMDKMQREMAKVTAAQVAKEKLNNFNGALEMLMGTIDTTLIVVGQMFLPALTRVVQAVGVVADAFLSLVNTPLGRYLVMATAAVTSFIFVFGSLVPFVRTLVSVVQVLGVVAMKTAASFAPYIAIAGVAIVAYQAFSSFKDLLASTEKPATGLWGALQKVGMVLWTIGQVMSTWNGKTFDLGGNEARLQALGMLGTVKALSTYIVRFIELAKGIGSGIYEVFAGVGGVITTIISYIAQGLQGLMRYFGMNSAALKYSSSQLQTWISVGKVLGYVIGTILVGAAISLTASLASMAIAVIAATWPLLAIVAAVGAVVAVFYYWDDIVAWVSQNFQKAMKWMGDGITRLWTQLKNGGATALQAIGDAATWLWAQLYNGGAYALQAMGEFLMTLPIYFGEALYSSWQIIYKFFTKLLHYAVGYLIEFGGYILKTLPDFFAKAFHFAVQAGYWALTEGLPMLLKNFNDFNAWVGGLILKGIHTAFKTAIEGGYWAITEGLPLLVKSFNDFNAWVGGLIVQGLSAAFTAAMEWGYWAVTDGLSSLTNAIGEFLVWTLVTIPTQIGQAFGDAFAWAYNQTSAFFAKAGDFFRQGGEWLINSLWQGMLDIWGKVEAWLQDTVSYATLGFMEGSQSATNKPDLRPNPASAIGQQIADMGAIKALNTVNQTTHVVNDGGNYVFNLDFGEGETLQKVVQKQSATKEARR